MAQGRNHGALLSVNGSSRTSLLTITLLRDAQIAPLIRTVKVTDKLIFMHMPSTANPWAYSNGKIVEY